VNRLICDYFVMYVIYLHAEVSFVTMIASYTDALRQQVPVVMINFTVAPQPVAVIVSNDIGLPSVPSECFLSKPNALIVAV